MLRTYKELIVWQKSRALVKSVYVLTQAFPADERFGLTAQIRRAAVSIPSNIAEGYGRGTTKDYLRFIRNANGSLCELETQLLLASDLSFGDESRRATVFSALAEVERRLSALIRSLRTKANPL